MSTRRYILADHRGCGGAGCPLCNERGTKSVLARRPVGLQMPSETAAFDDARQLCPCYEGISVNEGVAQCTNADRRDDGEWCDIELCPLVERAGAAS